MPFDGTNAPFREPYRDRRSPSSRVQLALRGRRPIRHSERMRRWKRKVVGGLLYLLGL